MEHDLGSPSPNPPQLDIPMNITDPIPDLRWYAGVSKQRGVTVRCGYATARACPRFYQSLSLMAQAGSTEISKSEDSKLLKFWKKSDLWPNTAEQRTALLVSGETPTMFTRFCPEVVYERFGYFATYLDSYADDIDREAAYARLKREGAPPLDPRWQWQTVQAQHYTECPVYSVLIKRGPASPPLPWWREHGVAVAGMVVALVSVLAKCAGT